MAIRFSQTKRLQSTQFNFHRCFVKTFGEHTQLTRSRFISYSSCSIHNREKLSRIRPPLILQRHLSYDDSYIHEDKFKTRPKVSFKINHKYTEIQTLLENHDLRESYLDLLSTIGDSPDLEPTFILENFSKALDIASQFPLPEVFEIIFNTWYFTFLGPSKPSSHLELLRNGLLQERSRLVNLMLNERKYRAYEQLITPLLSKFKLEPLWADTLAQTLQITRDKNGEFLFNKEATITSLTNGSVTDRSKRQILSSFIRIGILHCESTSERYSIIEHFFELIRHTKDQHLNFVDPTYQIYERALRLIISLPDSSTSIDKHISTLRTIIESRLGADSFQKFLTSTMSSFGNSSPKLVLQLWEHKYNISINGEEDPKVLNHLDLKFGMNALRLSKKYEQVLDLYKRFPNLHNDDQIEVLLRVSEEFKDWKLLQEQFEEMYGRGQLPYVIHYAVVMNGLASIGAREQIEQLYAQLMKRNLKPAVSIFAALINASIYYDDTERATYWFNQYKDAVDRGVISNKPSAYLYTLIFRLKLRSNNISNTMDFLADTVKEQNQTNVKLIDSQLLAETINFAATNYGLKEVQQISTLASKLDLTTEELTSTLVRAYTRLGEYQRAEKVAHEGHSNSLVPFKSSKIYKAQLRNYRFWYRYTLDPELKNYIGKKRSEIITLIEKDEVSIRNSKGLLTESIKYLLDQSLLEEAQNVLTNIKERNVLTEDHYIPFMKYHSRLGSFEGYQEIINIYREMASYNLKLTSKTYFFLIQSLIHIDQRRRESNSNSAFKLLQSIFELNGLTMYESDKAPTAQTNLFEESVYLCRIVCKYVMSASDNGYISNTQLVTHFLDQIKERLGTNLPIELRFSLYEEMAKLYFTQGHTDISRKLVDSGMDEIHSIVDRYIQNYPFPTTDKIQAPFQLQLAYRNLLKLKLLCIEELPKNPSLFLTIFNEANSRNLRLSGQQYTKVIKELLHLPQDKSIDPILTICEEYLVQGNEVEVNMMKHLQFLYKLVMAYQSRFTSHQSLARKYEIFNRYYDVRDFNKLQQEFSNIKEIPLFITKELNSFNRLWSGRRPWTFHEVMAKIAIFFQPERKINSWNKIEGNLAGSIYHAVNNYCNGDKLTAFKLMDEFPETIEFLLYNSQARLRHHAFRKDIDELIPPPSTKEPWKERRERTIQALKNFYDLNLKT